MKKFIFFALVLAAGCCRIESSVPACIRNGEIVLETPAPEKGQMNALGLTAEPIDTVRVGFIGVGMRGSAAVLRYTFLEGVKIAAICDLDSANVAKSVSTVTAKGLPEPASYVGEDAWKTLCEREDIDLVYICTDWLKHTPMAVYAMQHGKHVAVEVPSAMSIRECWDLVNTCELTRKHCMMLENCVYDFFEATALNMARSGLFGDMLYAEGGYIHNLERYWDRYHNDWRLEFNRAHRGDVYPTHGLGPLCQCFGIHREDLMVKLVSVDTRSENVAAYAREHRGWEDFRNGDHTVTLITTEKGRVIEIQHNISANRPYSRLYSIEGTEGYATKYPGKKLCLKGGAISPDGAYDSLDGEKFIPKELYDSLMTAYCPAYISEIKEKAKAVGGHGGMDFIMDYRLIHCLRNGLPLDMDVYDAAEWCSLVELSSISLDNGNIPVAIPDFTRGAWRDSESNK